MDKKLKDLFQDYINTEIQPLIDYVNGFAIEVGIIDGVSEDERDKKKDKNKVSEDEKDKSGVSNSELLFIHEQGSYARHIPPRPVLVYTMEDMYNNKDSPYHYYMDLILDGIMYKNWKKKEIDEAINKLGIEVAKYAKELISNRDSRFPPNAPSTIKAKSKNGKLSDIPLSDTNQLKRAIAYRIIKKN